jgi:hypothetical protein
MEIINEEHHNSQLLWLLIKDEMDSVCSMHVRNVLNISTSDGKPDRKYTTCETRVQRG